MVIKRAWLKRTAGTLILSTGLYACPDGRSARGPATVDPTPVIGDHTERRDREAPGIDEEGIRLAVEDARVRVSVPLVPANMLQLAERVNVTVAIVDGQSEEERAHATVQVLGANSTAELDLVPNAPLFTAQDGLGAIGRYILVVTADGAGGTTRVRRDMFRMVDYLDVSIVSPQQASADGTVRVQVVARQRSGAARANEAVTVVARGSDGAELSTASGTTSDSGVAEVDLAVPAGGGAAVNLEVLVGQGGALGRWSGALTLAQSRNILLTTDKPRYQPGQQMHLRALALQGSDRTPYVGPVVFEVSDARGNLLFKQAATTNAFGIASSQFKVGARVNEGTWKARLALGADGRGGAVAREITVEKYVLPRFKVNVAPSVSQARPGESVVVDVDAAYTFGVALNGGVANLQATLDGQLIADTSAVLSAEGRAQFTVQVPGTSDGRAAPLQLAVKVTDAAGGESTGQVAVQVVPLGVAVKAWFEGATSVAGANRLFVLLTDAAGTPVTGTVEINNSSQTVRRATDSGGLSVFDLSGLTNGAWIYVTGTSGTQQAASYLSAPASSDTALRVSAVQPVVDAGGSLTVNVDAPTGGARDVSVDVYAGGSLERSVDVALDGAGHGSVELQNVPGGLLRLVARDATGAVGQGAAYARQDRSLRVAVNAAATSYKPRDLAQVAIDVTDATGTGRAAAVGVTVVDEAVYALADVSGPVKSFNEGGALDAPAGMDADGVVAPTTTQGMLEAQRALLAYGGNQGALHQVDLGKLTRERAAREAVQMIQKDANDIGLAAYQAGIEPWSSDMNALHNWLTVQRFNDPWGNPYIIGNEQTSYYASIRSHGPDEAEGNADDLVAYVYVGGSGGWGGGGFVDADGAGGPQAGGAPAPAEGGASAGAAASSSGASGSTNTRGNPSITVRREFPETLLVQPMVLTDQAGHVNVDLPLADSITSWRVGAVASDMGGRMGVGNGAVRVFQDFFVDLDVPTQLTEGDEVAITAVINNFLPTPQDVTVAVETGTWGQVLSGNGQVVTVPAVSVTGTTVRIKADRVGTFPLMVRATGAGLQDALVRQVRVKPAGEEKPFTSSDRLTDRAQVTVTIPANATPGATELLVKVQPGVTSEVVNGLDSMLQMPGGCFEQTSSSNYPNVLVMQYLDATGQSMPEVEQKATAYMQEGYQRLTSYEVQGGGFSWFGDAPAHNVLTAYGLMQFVDMSRVFPVDPALVARTATWLAGQQAADGHFEPTAGGIAEGAINAYERNTFRTTAFLAWSLQRAGGQQAAVDRALNWLSSRAATETDVYALAVYANLLASISPDQPDFPGAVQKLLAAAQTSGDGVTSFPGAPPSDLAPCGGGSTTQTDLEVTALAAHALIVGESAPDVATQSLRYLVKNKDSFGTWQSTQATIRSLQAMLASLGTNQESAQGDITVRLDGEVVGQFNITGDNAAVQRIADLSERATAGTHVVEIERTGTGNFQYQVAGRTFGPRGSNASPVLTVTTTYSNPNPSVGEAVNVSTVVRTVSSFQQLLVDATIPPGFDLDPAALDALRSAGVLDRYEQQGNHLHLYVPRLVVNQPLTFTWAIRPRLGATVTAPPVRAYAYYDPSLAGESAPVTLTVQ